MVNDMDVCSLTSCSSIMTYGVDVSFPMHHAIHDGNPLGSHTKRKLYEDYINGCKAKYSSKSYACEGNERDRIDMNLNQPRSMFVSSLFSTSAVPTA